MAVLTNPITQTITSNTTLTGVAGKQYFVKNTSASDKTVTAGTSVFSLPPNAAIVLGYDGTNWFEGSGFSETQSFGNSYLLARTTTAQNVATATSTKIVFELESDPGDNYDNATGEYTVPTTGVYIICASLHFASGAWDGVNDSSLLYLAINGTQNAKIASDTVQTTASFGPRMNGTLLTSLTAGQKITILAFQNSGSTMANTTDANVNYFRVVRVV